MHCSMDLEETLPSTTSLVRCCDCGSSCCSLMDRRSLTGNWIRTVKRKFDEFEEGYRRRLVVIPDDLLYPNVAARVAIDNEYVALREMVSRQQQTIQDLSIELEKERNASSTAANEAMSMILRLQREKAETQMEFRQFKGYVEEKMAHDQLKLLALEDFLYKREQEIQSLTCEMLAYKHRMMSYGLTEFEAEGKDRGGGIPGVVENLEDDHQSEFSTQEYPPLKCNNSNESQVCKEPDNKAVDVEKYAFSESTWPKDHLKDLEYRINQLERNPTHSQPDQDFFGTKNVLEKVIVDHSPSRPRDFRSFSIDSSSSFFAMGKETGPDFATDSPKLGVKKMESLKTEDCSNLRKVDSASKIEDDRRTDIIYTVDDVQNAWVGVSEDYCNTPKESFCMGDVGDLEIKNLYTRLQALEADRESMRQTIVSMRTDKAQLVLLKEIAQQLCKDMPPARRMPVKKPSLIESFSFVSVFKRVVCFVFWRKKARRAKYMFGMSANNPGLPTLLDKGPHIGHWRCLLSTQV